MVYERNQKNRNLLNNHKFHNDISFVLQPRIIDLGSNSIYVFDFWLFSN